MKLRTKRNLTTAMQSGAMDAAKYQHFGACLRMNGELELAKAFESAAVNESTQHFSREAEKDLIGHGTNDLRNAINEETKRMNMLAQFEHEAIEDGDLNAAALFNRVCRDKAESCGRFQVMLAHMSVESDYRDVVETVTVEGLLMGAGAAIAAVISFPISLHLGFQL
jgi:rubrerythrin